MSVLLFALVKACDAVRPSGCEDNLRLMGLIFKMYAKMYANLVPYGKDPMQEIEVVRRDDNG